jgi:hypothetical protein
MHWTTKLAAAAIALAGVAGLSCAGPDESPIWSPTKAQYDPYGNAAMLSPANDSRVNLLMLLADRRRDTALPDSLGGRAFFAWDDLAEAVDPADDSAGNFIDPSRCQTAASGAADFLAAVEANRALKPAEKITLSAARRDLRIDCAGASDAGLGLARTPAVASAAGKGFVRYLEGAQAFYDGDFRGAATAFAAAAGAPDRWVAEAARYMAARTALNRAQATAFDEYGNLVEPAQRDRATLADAERGFADYLARYPQGRYAGSARGLLRRVHWLAGDDARLGADYAAAVGTGLDPRAALRLAEEIDYKLPVAQAAAAGPLLLAVGDLQRMRTAPAYDGMDPQPVLAAGALAAQAEAFAAAPALYDHLRAAHAFYVAKAPREVLALIPDDARRRDPSALQFSRQMLRGLALDALGDPNARGFWLELLGGATGPGRRQAVELALARHDETTGGIARVFAPDSQVRDPIARAILLQRTAGPALLRQQATRGEPHERAVALWTLLSKSLTRGFYADFLRDLALVPADAPVDGYFAEADAFAAPEDFLGIQPATGIFVRGPLDDYGCPSLRQTVATLEKRPLAPTARLCLGEFLRENGFDDFPFDAPLEQGLGSSKPLFPGTPITRQAIYRGVIADPAASAADKAYALFRAVHCYGPAGYNSCGGEDAPLSTRKAWFQRLKRDYPQSRWARELKYYW